MKDHNAKKIIILLMLTFFLDFVGLFMIIPILSPSLLNPKSAMLSLSTPYDLRTIIIGLLMSIYGIGQFLGGPIFGELSDQYGRKKILIIALTFSISAYTLAGFSQLIHSLTLLFISRFLAGFGSGNGSVLFATAIDLSSTDKERGVNLNYLTGAGSVGCVFGPIIGSHLTDSKIISWFNFSLPFFFIATLFVLDVMLIVFYFIDQKDYQKRKANIFSGIKQFFKVIKMPRINLLLLIYFLFVFSTESIFVSLPIFSVEKFKVSSLFLGHLFAVGAIFAAFISIYLNKKISKIYSSKQIFLAVTLLLTLFYLLFFIPTERFELFIPWTLAASTMVLGWAQANSIIANQVDFSKRGKILGISQSVLSAAITLGPTFVGFVAALYYNLAILLSAFSCALSGLIFYYWQKKINL